MRRLIITATVVSSLLLLAVAPAFAEGGMGPWWHLTFSPQPSYIQPGQAKDAVQQITLSANTGSYELRDEGVGPRFEGDSQNVYLKAGEEPKNVQKAIEGMYGAGNVEVTSPCTGVRNPSCAEVNNRYEVYEVKFVGKLTDRYVYPMIDEEEEEGPLRVKVIAKGRPDGTIVVEATNLGDASTVGCRKVGGGAGKYLDSRCREEATAPGMGEYERAPPITLTDKLPAGLTAIGIEAVVDESTDVWGTNSPPLGCALGSLSCTFTGSVPTRFAEEFPQAEKFPQSEYPSSVPPYDRIAMRVAVNVSGATSPVSTKASITGGEAPAVAAKAPLTISDAPVPFGLSSYEMRPEEAGGGIDTQAGSHPFQFTTSFAINKDVEGAPESKPVALTKDLHFKLPPGVIGNPVPFAQCSLANFLDTVCPADTVVGVSMGIATLLFEKKRFNVAYHEPLYNIEPAFGEPAQFGFIVDERGDAPTPVLLNTAVRTGGDYSVTVNVSNITQVAEFRSSEVTFWGTPGDARHNFSRGLTCIRGAYQEALGEVDKCPSFAAAEHPPPLMTLPTSCSGPLHTTMEASSWPEPATFASLSNTEPMPALDGCNRLPFAPEIKVSPDSQQGSKPTGLTVDVHVPQEGQLNPEGLAQSNIRNIVVTLPQGVILNPSAADGLEGCSEHLIGYEGSRESPTEPGVSNSAFTPYLPGSTGALAAREAEPLQPGVNFCPNASKIAEATIRTPLLPNPLKGFVYLASPQNFAAMPQENPFETHVVQYLVAEDPVSGSLVKLPGKVELGGEPGVEGLAPGQIRSTFADNPQLPFEDAELHFFGGERAPLASPTHCGTYTTNATFTPWSGTSSVNSSSSFQITSGPNNTPCPGPSLPFSPSLASGTTNNNAGGYTPLSTTLSRPDGNQSIQSVTLHYPPGLSGSLSGVELCGEAQANAGTCGPNSQIGETIVSVGVGGDPFTVTGGKAYITGPYAGAPFGLSIVNPAKAGPFNLQEGRPVVVRAKVEVNPLTAALTITTTPTGQYAIPNIIEGFPLQIQHVNVLINRPGFTFNPTSCSPMKVTGTINSSEGASLPVEVPFQATNCASLKFEPKISVFTQAHTSKANGASLTYKIAYPNVPQGTDANIHYVKVELPSELPSRLTTLQKACTQKQFQANPASCPGESVIGHAKAIVPNIPVPLEGPVYFVSNGGEAFPNLVMVLQGYGVTVELVGDTLIRNGVTSTTFNAIPDNPVTSFEITLPEGPYSALAANGNLCKPTVAKTVKKKVRVQVNGRMRTVTRKVKEQVATSLTIPSDYIGQNGAPYNANVPIKAEGCAKAKPAKKATKHKTKRKSKKK